ncbi:MAG TPA: tRNA-dihydrouridine synthase [Candidatus Paceibacterota bacterium]|nr:tRNA-dihydrouridine synthase [Candidatus Paceibacterota bacterium]
MQNFWEKLPKPIFVLAPMADVTDAAFRRIIAKYSKLEPLALRSLGGVGGGVGFVTYTEFVSADGLALAPKEGRDKLLRDLMFSDAERPIVAQFFTSTPAHMEAAAKLAQELGFDGVDINMGCPDKSIEKQGAGAKLILNPARAQELIAAAKRGAPNLPVSVKTRLGYNKDMLEEWMPALLEAEPAVVTIHARTRKEMSLVPARWERVKRAVEIRNELGSKTLIIGNGDVVDVADAKQKIKMSGADGAMLGRAIFGTPWLFATQPEAYDVSEKVLGSASPQPDHFPQQHMPPLETRLRIAVEHAKLFEELLGDVKNFAIMKKHFKAYAEGFAGAKELRMQLMETKNAAEIEQVIERFLCIL